MNLSQQAIIDLRKAIRNSYGKDLEISFSDEEIEEIGEFLLTSLAESLKIKSYKKYEEENYFR